MMREVPVAELGRFLVPLEPRAIARWFARRLHVPASPAAAWRALVVPRTLPLRARAVERDPVARLLADGAASALDGTPLAGRELAGIVVRDFPGKTRGRRLAFLFEPGAASPVAALKLRARGPGASLHREGEALRSLRARLPADLARALPEVVALRELGDDEVLVLALLPGRPGLASVRSSAWPSLAAARRVQAALEWLAQFQLATARQQGRAAGHGDFWLRNVLFDARGGLTGVVDWERSSDDACVLDDAFHLVLTTALDLPRGWGRRRIAEAAFRHGFIDDNGFSRAMMAALRAHAQAVGIDPRSLRERFAAHLRRRPASPPHDENTWRCFADLIETASRCAFSG